MSGKFFIAPNAVLLDDRLTKIQIRVLLGLYSFRDNKSKKAVTPKRSTLTERVGYSESVISRATKQLVELGWLKKTGSGGRSAPCSYLLIEPQTVTEPVRVNNQETVTEPVTVSESVTVTDSDTKTVTEPVRGKEQTIEQTVQKICRKPESWKSFYKAYPENKRGARDESAWKKAKSLKLTDTDFDDMLDDVLERRRVCPTWYSTYALGICKYIDQHFWKTEIVPEARHEAHQRTSNKQAVNQSLNGQTTRDWRRPV